MKTLRYTFLWVAILVTVATAENRSAPNPQELDIAETVFRYQMAQSTDYAIGTNATAFYLDFKDSDPPTELLMRFTRHSPPVKARSDVDNNETMAVRDSHTRNSECCSISKASNAPQTQSQRRTLRERQERISLRI